MSDFLDSLWPPLKALYVAAVLFCLGFNFWTWIRNGAWFPTYLHVIAVLSALLGLGLTFLFPLERRTAITWFVLPVVFPFLVYTAFIFLGGAAAAHGTPQGGDRDDDAP